jgi:hypothetical protein
MEGWARSQNGSSLVDFSSRDGEIESILKDISERAKGKGNFSYSRFFAVGLFRLLELANATEPTVLDKVVPLTINFSCHVVKFFVFAFLVYCVFSIMLPISPIVLVPIFFTEMTCVCLLLQERTI